ncbi:MAG: hypothetical protein HZB26_05665 [Candidatus Hydrogenedentes bacterium]|nr:hypothetical protein [Candidatus Hydrogenedentota bacterium]
MKKMIIASMFVAIAVSGAYAVSLSVPWFVDLQLAQGGNGMTLNTGNAQNVDPGCYIAISNCTNDTLTIKVRYFALNGTEASPANNTFLLTAGQGTGWRPVYTDTAQEPTSVGATNFNLSTMNKTDGISNGSARITWSRDGSFTDAAVQGEVTGRLLEMDVNGNRAAYTLPNAP